MSEFQANAPGVIVVAEPQISELLANAGASWTLQERQSSVAEMWDSLSGGRISDQSRILVFSDSLKAGDTAAAIELEQTARAIVAMANAGAHVFIAVWRSAEIDELQSLIDQAAQAAGLRSEQLTFHYLPVERGGRDVLEQMRGVLSSEVSFPEHFPEHTNRSLTQLTVAPVVEVAPVELAQPEAPVAVPTLTIGQPTPAQHAAGSGASAELLARPPKPGQVTITVTSSKGGSGKSTAALLLAGAIARASREGGRPLSVCVVDMDTRDGQVASLIGKYMPTALNIRVQPVWDEETIKRHLVREESLGIDALLAPIRPRTADTVGPDFYRTMIRSLQRMYDVVVMDTSVQYLDPLIATVCLPEATEVLFITTLASTAVQGMARALREITAPVEESGLGIDRDKIGIIVNQSVADVGMQREQILAAGLGVPVVGVIPLATKDVLTATNLHKMHTLLDHPTLGPAYNDLARTCLPGHGLAEFTASTVTEPTLSVAPIDLPVQEMQPVAQPKHRGLFRRH